MLTIMEIPDVWIPKIHNLLLRHDFLVYEWTLFKTGYSAELRLETKFTPGGSTGSQKVSLGSVGQNGQGQFAIVDKPMLFDNFISI